MNKMLCLASAGAMLLTGTAMAQGELSVAGSPTRVLPIKVAQILGRNADGSYIVGEFHPYQERQTDGLPGVLIDTFGTDVTDPDACDGDATIIAPADGPLTGGYAPTCDPCGLGGDNCNAAGCRWFWGTTTVFGPTIFEVTGLAGGASAGTVQTVDLAWFQALATGGGIQDPCTGSFLFETYTAITVYDSTVGSQIDGVQAIDATDLSNGFKGGVILGFGPIAAGGWYFTGGVDLVGPGLEFPVASGDAVEVALIDSEDGGNTFEAAFYGQPMIWGSKNAAGMGTHGSMAYVDGFNGGLGSDCPNMDFEYDPAVGEAQDYGFGVCPDPLAANAVALLGVPEAGGPVCADTSVWTNASSTSGTAADTCGSNDVRFAARRATFTPASTLLLTNTSTFDANGLGAGGGLVYNAEVSIDNAGVTNVRARLVLVNQVGGSNATVLSAPLTTTDTVVTLTVANGADFIDANGFVTAQVVFVQTSGGPNWNGRIDDLNLNSN